MPCIGGSPWQHVNRHKPGGLEKLDAHIKSGIKYGRPLRSLPENVLNTMVILQSSGLRVVITGEII